MKTKDNNVEFKNNRRIIKKINKNTSKTNYGEKY